MTSNTTAHVAVWEQLKGLKGDDLTVWRMNAVENRATVKERNLDTLPLPFGWFMVAYSDELEIGEVKPLYYFGKDLVLWRGEDGQARIVDAYCKHLGAHMGYGGRVKGNSLECPFHACEAQWKVVESNKQVLVWYHPFNVAPKWEPESFDQVHDPDWTEYQKYE